MMIEKRFKVRIKPRIYRYSDKKILESLIIEFSGMRNAIAWPTVLGLINHINYRCNDGRQPDDVRAKFKEIRLNHITEEIILDTIE